MYDQLYNKEIFEGKLIGYITVIVLLSVFFVSMFSGVARGQTSQESKADIVLVIDKSGSMEWDWKGEQKFYSAQKASKALIDVLPSTNQVSIVSFSFKAKTELGLTNEFENAKTAVDEINVGGATNIYDGLDNALTVLENQGTASSQNILLLTDGHISDLRPEDENKTENAVKDELVPEASDKDITIYTVGFGEPMPGSHLKENFLKDVANGTGGEYYYSERGFDLQNDFITVGEQSSGFEIKDNFEGEISQGENVIVGSTEVESGTERTRIILNWPGSDLDLTLIDPQGNEVDPDSDDIIYSGSDSRPEYYDITDPKSGEWEIKVHGKSVDGSEEDYFVGVSGMSGSGGLDNQTFIIVGVVAVLIAGGAFFYFKQ